MGDDVKTPNSLRSFGLTAILLISTTILAGEVRPEIHLNAELPYVLSQEKAPEVGLRVDYPGEISGYCAIKLFNPENDPVDMNKILEELTFDFYFYPDEAVSIQSGRHEASLKLHLQTYVDIIQVKSKSGETMEAVLKRLQTHLEASAVPCKGN